MTAGSNNKQRPTWHISVGIPLALAGIGILVPAGFKEAALSLLNRWLSLNLKLDGPMWLGISLLGLGLIVLLWSDLLPIFQKPQKRFIAFRHHSLDSDAARLSAKHLGSEHAHCKIIEIDSDQSAFLTKGVCDPRGALRHLMSKLTDLRSARSLDGEVPIAYYGLAHVALQFAAGFEMSCQSQFMLFEQNRNNGSWRPLVIRGPSLDLTLTTVELPPFPKAIAIRIPISYEIQREDIKDVLDGPFEDFRLGLNTPRVDAISAYNQINEVAVRFRQLLDEAHTRHNNGVPVHVFYAGPACLGISLGRQINKNIHYPVFIHQYDGGSKPRYRWALNLTSIGSGTEPKVLIQPAMEA